MDYEIFVTGELGDNSYILFSNKKAIMVDPQRDIGRFQEFINDNDLRLEAILETHVHNDYITGALELKDLYGANLYLPEKGDYEFEHHGVSEGFDFSIGDLNIQAMETPGHTYEHISWVIEQKKEPVAAFTGGSMIIGSAGRTDLVGEEHTQELTKLQYESIQKIKQLPDHTRILPTHGSGSFCTSSNPSEKLTSTVRQEKETNQAATASNLEEFMDRQLSGLLRYPDYYRYMADINREGPEVYGGIPQVNELSLSEFKEHMANGSYIIDTRDREDFASKHIKGSYNFELLSSFASYVGWILPFNAPILLIVENQSDATKAVTDLFRIGYESVQGYLSGGLQTWIDNQLPTETYETIKYNDLVELIKNNGENVKLLDVRQDQEYQDYHLEDSSHVFVADIIKEKETIPKSVYLYCKSGQRAVIGASILNQSGFKARPVSDGGIEELIELLKDQ